MGFLDFRIAEEAMLRPSLFFRSVFGEGDEISFAARFYHLSLTCDVIGMYPGFLSHISEM